MVKNKNKKIWDSIKIPDIEECNMEKIKVYCMDCAWFLGIDCIHKSNEKRNCIGYYSYSNSPVYLNKDYNCKNYTCKNHKRKWWKFRVKKWKCCIIT